MQGVRDIEGGKDFVAQLGINYIIYSGLVFFIVFLIGLIYINSKDDPTPILKKMIKGFYHNRFWDWIQKQHTKLGNWLWAKRWRNFEK